MPIKIATAAFAALILASFGSSSPSQAQTGCSYYHHHRPCAPPVYRGTQHCYYLPTVANGRVTGVEKVCQWY